jgi:hypothetical protein
MASNLYYVMAVAVGAFVVMIFLGLQSRGQESAVETTQYSMSRSRTMTAAEMIERDLRNMGAGKREIETVFPAGGIDTTSCMIRFGPTIPCRFTFWGRVDSVHVDTSLVRYEWYPNGTAVVEARNPDTGARELEQVDVFELQRLVDGAANTLHLERVSEFRMNLFDDFGVPISGNPAMARRIDVTLGVLMPRGDEKNDLERLWWETSVRPVNLTR